MQLEQTQASISNSWPYRKESHSVLKMIYKNRKHIPLGKYLLNNLSFKNYYCRKYEDSILKSMWRYISNYYNTASISIVIGFTKFTLCQHESHFVFPESPMFKTDSNFFLIGEAETHSTAEKSRNKRIKISKYPTGKKCRWDTRINLVQTLITSLMIYMIKIAYR